MTPQTSPPTRASRADSCLIRKTINLFSRIPDSLIALLARFALAATFWSSGQTKVQGFAINFITGNFEFGWPQLSDSVVELFREEYKLPIIPPELAAPMAAFAEHLFPLLLLIGLATRFSALALLGMTMTIQIFVYPDAYALHGAWAACLLFLMAKGGGAVSVDALIARRCGATGACPVRNEAA
jgi:putative oxidoreductase